MDGLKSYGRLKQEIAVQLRQLLDIFRAQADQASVDACRQLMAKLAEDRFILAVLGQFKRGKSTLMNALIGRDLLPTGVIPLTSVITVLRFAPEERLLIERGSDESPRQAALENLAEYVTETDNPGNEKGITRAILELPLPFLRAGLEFVDTPGVGSGIEANDGTTYTFLHGCDAALFVTSVESPLSAGEIDFLRAMRQHVRKLFFVVNKIDLVTAAQRRQVLKYIQQTLDSRLGVHDAHLFAVSALTSLHARESDLDNPEAYGPTGLGDLQRALEGFLAHEKATSLLLSVIDRALLIAEHAASGAATDATPHTAAGPGSLGRAGSDPSTEPPLARIRTRLAKLRSSARGESAAPEQIPLRGPSDDAGPELPRSATPPADAEIARELGEDSCPVCHHLGQTLFSLLATWQHQLASAPEVQQRWATDGGFCPLHTWQLAAISSARGGALGSAKLAQRTADALAGLMAHAQLAAPRVMDLVQNPGACPVCRSLYAAEDAHVRRLAAWLRHDGQRQEYRRSQGACLRHLGLLIQAANDPALTRFLLAAGARRFENWAEDMQNFALKQDALRRGLQNADERAAWQRMLVHLAGEARLCTPWTSAVPPR